MSGYKQRETRTRRRIAIRHLRNGINLAVSVTLESCFKCICIWNQRSNGTQHPSTGANVSSGMERENNNKNLIRLHNASWTYRWSAWLEWRCWMPLCMHVGGGIGRWLGWIPSPPLALILSVSSNSHSLVRDTHAEIRGLLCNFISQCLIVYGGGWSGATLLFWGFWRAHDGHWKRVK